MPLKNISRETTAGILFVIAFIFMAVVRQYYTWEMPQLAEVSSGRTIAVLVNYGKIVYVTATEQALLNGSYLVLGLTVIASVAVSLAARTKR